MSGSLNLRKAVAYAFIAIAGLTAALFDFSERPFPFKKGDAESNAVTTTHKHELPELSAAVGMLRDHYAFQARLKPLVMLLAALQGMERELDFIEVAPNVDLHESIPPGGRKFPTHVQVRFKDRSSLFDVTGVDDLYEMTWKLLEIFDALAPEPEEADQMEEAAIEGMLSVLDPHTSYLTQQEYREMKSSTQGSFGGLGIVISVRHGRLLVMSVLPGTPASRANLQKGDHIVQIDQESTVNMTVSEAARRMRGKPGTTVTLTISRGETGPLFSVSLVREVIRVESVFPRKLDPSTAYLRVRSFQQDTCKEVEDFLDSAFPDAAPSGVILDLRGNSGGVMAAAVCVADLFLPEGAVVTTVAKVRKGTETKKSVTGSRYEESGLVVLVDHGSASASEIVAGALKYRDRGLIIGNRTFGKGSVQLVNELHRGALKLTVAQYVGPQMEAIQGVGIEPHVDVRAVRVGQTVTIPSFSDSFSGEGALPYHLVETGAVPVFDSPAFYLRYVRDEEENEENLEEYGSVVIDYPVRLAWSLLSLHGHRRASAMLEKSLEYLEDSARWQEERLAEVAAMFGKEWNDALVPTKPDLVVTASVEPDTLIAGQEGTLSVHVLNRGEDVVPRLYARTESSNVRFTHKTCILGTLSPGEASTCKVRIRSPFTSPARLDQVFVDVLTGMDETLARGAVQVPTEPLFLSRPALSWRIDDAAGNGDGLVQPGEQFDLVVNLRNEGNGVLKKGLVTLKNLSGPALFVKSGRVDVADLAPGASRTARFTLVAQAEPQDKVWRFELGVSDLSARRYFGITEALVSNPGQPAGRASLTAQERPGETVAYQTLVSIEQRNPEELLGSATVLQISGTADFGPGSTPFECGLSVFRNDQKVAMDYLGNLAEGVRTVKFAFTIDLEKGVNRILVTAFQKNRSPGYASVYYNRLK